MANFKFIDLETGVPALWEKVKAAISSALAAKQDKLTFDSTPTSDSTNPVTSGGIYSAINAVKVDGYTVKKDDSGYYIEV